MAVKAICRNCNREANADDFKLHYKLRQMVCPDCFSGRTEELRQRQQQIKIGGQSKSVGWDVEDDYLEKAARIKKEENQAQFSKIPGTDYVKCMCSECKFEFRYNPFKKQPRTCPYCNREVPKLRTFNLL